MSDFASRVAGEVATKQEEQSRFAAQVAGEVATGYYCGTCETAPMRIRRQEMTQTQTHYQPLRSAILADIREEYAFQACAKDHESSYQKLYVWRDGKVEWKQFHNQHEGIIDREAAGFAEVPYLVRVGTGGYMCNCDACGAGESPDFGQDELDEIAIRMERSLAEIDLGYFNGEAGGVERNA